MNEFGNLIDGKWVVGEAGEFATRNPAHPDVVVGRYSSPSREQIAHAVDAAASAQRKWRAAPASERFSVFERYLKALETKVEELAHSITLEQGKPLAESRGEVAKSIAEARFMAGEALRGHSEVMPSARPGIRNLILRRPRGVIAAITPWNFPILTPMRKLAPALVFGNAIVLKPSEFSPLTTCLLADTGRDILPSGLLQVLIGAGETAATLIGMPAIAGVTFTGSVATGKRVYAAGAANLCELSLELGGKNAAVIHDVRDLDACLNQITLAACMCAGQRCTAISRVIVNRAMSGTVVEGLVGRFRSMVLGDGMEGSTNMGPLINEQQRKRVASMVDVGVHQGARVATGGRPAQPRGAENGYFYQPTVLSDVRPTMSVAREEIFGPVISVIPYESLDEAFHILNSVDYGLTSALFAQDNAVIQRFIDESENGMIHINHGTIPDNHMPFGGIKNSGVGAYSVGASSTAFFTTEHSVYVKAG